MTTALNFPKFAFNKPELDELYKQGVIGATNYMNLRQNAFQTVPSQQSTLAQRLMDSMQSQNAQMASMRNTNMFPASNKSVAGTMNIAPLANTGTKQAQPMAQGQGPSFRFQDLNRAFQLDPRNTLANTLMQQGMRGGPVRTPLEGIGRLSQSLVGAMLQKRALDRLEGQETTRIEEQNVQRDNLTKALQNINLDGKPALAALAEIDPLAALEASVKLELAPQPQKTINLSKEMANALNLDTKQGQVYQQDSSGKLFLVPQGKAPTPLGTSFQALAGQEIQRLFNLGDNRTEIQTQTMNILSEQLKKPRIYTTFDNNNNQITVKEPGVDILSILSGGQSGQTTTATSDGSQQQDGQSVDGVKKDGSEILGKKVQKLSEQEANYVSKYSSAAADIKTVIDIMFNGDLYNGDYNKAISVAAGKEIGRMMVGSDAQRLNDALANLLDLRLRDRTGAQANPSEIALYESQVYPGLTTRADAQRDRILRLLTEVNSRFKAFSQGRDLGIEPLVIPKKAEVSKTMEVEFD